MRKKDVALTINLIKNHLRGTEHEFSKEVFLNNRVIAENANARGVLHSGMTIREMIKNIDQVIDSKLEITLDYVQNF